MSSHERPAFPSPHPAGPEANQTANALHALLEHVTDGVIAYDTSWRIIFLNARATEILSPLHSSENLLGRIYWEAFPDSVGGDLERHFLRALRDQVTVQFESRCGALDAWFEIRAFPSPHGLTVFFQDVTDRKRHSEILHQNREWLAVILRSIGDAVVAVDTAERVTFLNPVAEAMTGWRSDEAIGRALADVFRIRDDTTRREAHPPVRTVFDEGRAVGFSNHTTLISRHGMETPIEDSAAPIRRADGTIAGAVMVFHDVTARRQAEQSLRRSEERWRGVFTNAAVGIALADLTGQFIQVNPKFCELLGYSADELAQLRAQDLTHPDDRPQTVEFMRQLVAGEISHYTMEKRYTANGGRILWSLTTVTVVRNAEVQPHQFIGVVEDITPRKVAERETRRSQERLTLALAAGGLGDWEWDAATDRISLGPSAVVILGLDSPTIAWSTLRELLHPDDCPIARAIVERAIQNRTDFAVEYRLNKRSGQTIWVAARGRSIHRGDGSLAAITGVVADITDRKLAEFELRASEERFRSIVEATPDCVKVVARDGTLLAINSAGCRIVEVAHEHDVIGQSIYPLIAPEFRDAFVALNQNVCSGAHAQLEFQIEGRCGTRRWMQTHAVPMRDPRSGETVQLAVTRDITERRQAEERLRHSEEELRALANSISQLAWIANPEGHIYWYNTRWVEYTGQSIDSAKGWSWQDVHDPEILPDVLKRWNHCLQSGEPFEMEFPLRGQDGVFRWFLTRAVPVRDRSGRVLRWFGTNTDVDAVRRAQDELRRAQLQLSQYAERLEEEVADRTASLQEAIRQLEQFSYSVSHDLRAPLRAIAGYNEILKTDFGPVLPPEGQTLIDRIERNAQRMDRLVNDMLTLSRVARSDLQLAPIPLQPLLAELLEHQPNWQTPAARLTIDAPHTVCADRLSLEQALANLINNAVKFVPPGQIPEVTVRSERLDDIVRIWIEDRGIGIPPEHRAKLFNMFQRLPAGITFEGTGIGLAIVRTAVERMQGRVGMEPNLPHGSRFYIELQSAA